MQYGRRTNQGGSVAVFAIVAFLLSAAVIGGVYLVQKRGYQVRSGQPIMETVTQPQPSDEQKKADEEKTQQEQQKTEADKQVAEQKAADDKKKADEQKRLEAEKQKAAEAERQRQQQAQANNQAPTPQATVPQTGVAPQPTEQLPTTGPEENLIQVAAGGIMLALVMAYLKSYRHRFGSLLK